MGKSLNNFGSEVIDLCGLYTQKIGSDISIFTYRKLSDLVSHFSNMQIVKWNFFKQFTISEWVNLLIILAPKSLIHADDTHKKFVVTSLF